MRGPMPSTTIERKPDLNLERLAAFADWTPPPSMPASYPAPQEVLDYIRDRRDERRDLRIRSAGDALVRERRARNTFERALRRLVAGIDQADGTTDAAALAHARRVLGIDREGER